MSIIYRTSVCILPSDVSLREQAAKLIRSDAAERCCCCRRVTDCQTHCGITGRADVAIIVAGLIRIEQPWRGSGGGVWGAGGVTSSRWRGTIWTRTAGSYLPAEAVCETVTASPDFPGRRHQTAQWESSSGEGHNLPRYACRYLAASQTAFVG